ncbi:MAG: sigma 54-interacting transcriptional regulator [Gemmatimonadota bacterium]
MNESVLISTHRLPAAGALREAFQRAGYQVELVTPDEDLARYDEATLLVLTGTADAAGLAHQAQTTLSIPLFAFLESDLPEERAQAEQLGADELFSPPSTADDVLVIARATIGRRRLQELTGIVGESAAIQQALERVVQIAPVDSTVLVTGESGTGKELVARGIHALSPRRHKRFIAVNVAALPETLLESELFGHEKGAFTGAIDSRRGFFELADGGTIFLDEIGEMPLTTQSKLLRVLETREFIRVGGEKPIRVDVRIVAATNQDLGRLVALGEFRRDLFYRLNVLSIELPPLRERKEDIPLLVRAFIRELTARHDRTFVGINPEAMALLQSHRWPGNVRELRNLIESMVVLAPGREIRPEDIPDNIRRRRIEPELLHAGLPVARVEAPVPSARPAPELEFIFRTLVELRMDMDDLRRQFELYQQDSVRRAPPVAVLPAPQAVASVRAPEEDERVVVYRPGLTMDDMEQRAIAAALAQHGGNRRRAARALGIGERTLYRKLQKYEMDA